jgi:hypothetical protein
LDDKGCPRLNSRGIIVVPDSAQIGTRGFDPNRTSQPFASKLAQAMDLRTSNSNMPNLDPNARGFLLAFIQHTKPNFNPNIHYANTGEIRTALRRLN